MICATCAGDFPWRAFVIGRAGGSDLARWCEACRAAWRARQPFAPRAQGTNPRARGTNPRAKGTNPRAQADHVPARATITLEELLAPLPPKPAPCAHCGGLGWLETPAGLARCPHCDGPARVRRYQQRRRGHRRRRTI